MFVLIAHPICTSKGGFVVFFRLSGSDELLSVFSYVYLLMAVCYYRVEQH